MKKPLVWLAVLFSIGIIAAAKIRVPLSWLYSGAVLLLVPAIFLLKGRSSGAILLAILVFVCGMAWFKIFSIVPADHISRFYCQSRKIYSLRGWVNSEPEFAENKTSFLFRTEEISGQDRGQSCCGEALAIIRGKFQAGYGEELVLAGKIQLPFGDFLRRKGILRIVRVITPDFIQRTGKFRVWRVKRMILELKSRIEAGFESSLSPVCAGVIEAMTLGEAGNVPPKVYKDMIRSGTVHILVVSGSNVGIVGFIIILFLKIIRIPRRARFFFIAPFLLVYCFLTGGSNPVVRATVMATVFLFSYFVKRQIDIYNSCAAAAVVILSIDPGQLFDIGFQLSFASVLAIAFFYSRLKDWLKLDQLKSRWLRYPAESCLISFSAWLGTAGLIAAYFRMVSPITVLANLLIVPLASLITLSGFGFLVAQYISPYLASSFVPVNEVLVSLLLGLNSLLLRLPHAYSYF
jgi:competence protein ComEC